ncbi:MAG: NUDIX hydrolase [Rhabdochlamydiaceae bacterium]|nr:NUDIX hydrolase [Rhabdochlamydiaceae bacterium]
MHTLEHQSLLEKLQQYIPSCNEQSLAKEQILSFVNTHPNCFERSLAVGHVTASAWLLSRDLTQVLLMHHAKLDRWLQPGGHCDGNPDVLAVAIKEAQEESGIKEIVPVMDDIFDIDIHVIPPIKQEKEHLHYDIRFLLRVASDEKIVKNSESKALKWFGKNPLELPTNELSVVRMHQKWTMLKG